MRDALAWSYLSPAGPALLQQVLRDADATIRHSEGAEQSAGAAPLTQGAVVVLRRLVERLQAFVP